MSVLPVFYVCFKKKIGIHSTPSRTATTEHDITRGKWKIWKAHRKVDLKEPKDKSCLSTLDLKQFRLQVKGKHSPAKEFQGLAVQGKKLLIKIIIAPTNGDTKNMKPIKRPSRSTKRIWKRNQFDQFRWTSTKAIPIKNTLAGNNSTMFKRGSKWSHLHLFPWLIKQ